MSQGNGGVRSWYWQYKGQNRALIFLWNVSEYRNDATVYKHSELIGKSMSKRFNIEMTTKDTQHVHLFVYLGTLVTSTQSNWKNMYTFFLGIFVLSFSTRSTWSRFLNYARKQESFPRNNLFPDSCLKPLLIKS